MHRAVVVEQNSVMITKWTTQISQRDTTSDFFELQGCKCKLKLNCDSFFQNLYLVKIDNHKVVKGQIIVCSSSSTNSQSHDEVHYLPNGDQAIWKDSHYSRSFRGTYTFKVIFIPDSSEETTVGSEVVQESQNLSDSKENIHLETLSKDLSKLWDESSTYDIKIACDGQTFNAHRIILGTRSAVFSALLKSNMIERKTGLIKVEDIKAPVFQSFLLYLYSGTLPVLNIDTAKQLYVVGDKYAVEELKKSCSEFLTKNLSEGNAWELLVISDQHSDKDFRSNVISYIVYKKIPKKNRQWPSFCKSHPSLAIDVMNVYIQKY